MHTGVARRAARATSLSLTKGRTILGAMDHPYWFVVTATFACPLCRQMSVEKIILNSPTTDPDKLRQKIDPQLLACEKCRAALPNRSQVAIEISPAYTREYLIQQGYILPPDI